MMGQEVLPPRRLPVTRAEPARVTASVPGISLGGVVDTYFAIRHHERQARAIDALTRHNVAEVALFNAQANVVDSKARLTERLFALQELPERLGHELALRRVGRLESFSQAVHDHRQNELRREMESTYSRADVTRARIVLVDAEQQLQAQRDYGYAPHVLTHKKKGLEILKVELAEAEARALWDKHYGAAAGGSGGGDDGSGDSDEDAVINDALLRSRQELKASNLDTSQIDAVIRARRDR